MKLSLAWIFDHIDADWKQQDVQHIVKKFNEITAEIEHVHKIHVDLSAFALGTMENHENPSDILIPEWKITTKLPKRDDLDDQSTNTNYYMVRRERTVDGFRYHWAQCADFGLEKGGNLSAFAISPKELDGSWKKRVEVDDYILEVDNKSITHRPDMWGHRGFAREIAAFLNLPLKPASDFLTSINVQYVDKKVSPTSEQPLKIENKAPETCSQFATLYCSSVDQKPCDLGIATRLMRVGSRPINGIVDLTNYVMLDWSQPMHAFDAKKLTGNQVIVRMAHADEKLTLLDDRTITLTEEDLVIANEKHAMSLAGIMGGKDDSINQSTHAILLEAAHFDPNIIRKSALRHKARTESSARFEKKLDPTQVTDALMRFIKLAQTTGISLQHAQTIICLGKQIAPKAITVSHAFLESRAGFTLTQQEVVEPLTRLGFIVTSEKNGEYQITIPSFRASKDVTRAEDILEEVIRFYGFNRIALNFPSFVKLPYDLDPLMRVRTIKNYLAGAAHMTELSSYALFNEQFIKRIGFAINEEAFAVVNPISEHYKRPVTSLVPALLEAITDNFVDHDVLNFFELARIWQETKQEITERKTLAGVFFHKKKPVDFYAAKSQLTGLFALLNLTVSWIKELEDYPFWASEFECARLELDGKLLGHAGKINPLLLAKLDVLPESDAFIFELNADILIEHNPAIRHFVHIPKYQESDFDLSFIVPLSLTVAELVTTLGGVDTRVRNVKLIDFFEKDSWVNERALAFRLIVGSADGTLSKEEIEEIRSKAINVAEQKGAKLRV